MPNIICIFAAESTILRTINSHTSHHLPMKPLRLTAIAALLTLSFSSHAQMRVSIFSDHIANIARQQGISFREAAVKVHDLGYTGVDVWVTIDPAEQAILDEVGFAHASAIAEIDFTRGEMSEQAQQAIDFMRNNHYDKALLVPGLMPEGATEALYNQVCYRTEAFAHEAAIAGVEVMIEDYDNPRSPCFNTEAIDRLFSRAPSLNHVFDTGNYSFAGEDVMTALRHFQPRIHHVHLKDRKALRDYASPAVGTGIVPMQEVIVSLLASGYKGWFCVEHFGAPDMLQYATTSIQTVRTAYEAFAAQYPAPQSMSNQMSEYWTPVPPVVTPMAQGSAPSDAIILFDGTSLDAWCTESGAPAQWNLHDGVMTVDKSKGDILTRQSFGSYQLHLEWCVPADITGESQWRGNSGVFMQDKYEVQILDSYQSATYVNGQAASIYKQSAPLVNAMLPPGQWNVYDIIYTAPVFKTDGTYFYRPYITVIHNGIVVQNHTEILGTTEWIGFPRVIAHGDGPIRLQSHGDPSAPISFRNIWLRPLN